MTTPLVLTHMERLSMTITDVSELDLSTINCRPGTPADSYAAFRIFQASFADLVRRMEPHKTAGDTDPQTLEKKWPEWRSLYDFLASSADQFWVAESDDKVIGYARSILHDGLQELTEFFISPQEQSAGLGRALLERAFPDRQARRRCIIATMDIRAQARYLKAGLYPRFPLYNFWRVPEARPNTSGLVMQPVIDTPETLAQLGAIDALLLEHRRDFVHSWLLGDRQGYLYLRDGRPVGYGYLGSYNGPFALLDPSEFPAVLAHAETHAVERGAPHFGIEVPMINRRAVDYLLRQGYQMDTFVTFMMTDGPFGKFEGYITTSPPFIL